jgi:transcription factor C subunit 6
VLTHHVQPFLAHKVFQMDHRPRTGEFRLLERFLPRVTTEPPATRARKAHAAGAPAPPRATIGVWPPAAAVHRAAWHSGAGPAASGWLAAGTAAGLVRVDWLAGRWMGNRVPYGSVDAMRGEGGVDMDMDTEDDDDE